MPSGDGSVYLGGGQVGVPQQLGLDPSAHRTFFHLIDEAAGADVDHELSSPRLRVHADQSLGQDEMPALQPLPKELPAPFDVIAVRKVSRDCLINFEGRRYCVPFDLTGRNVEVRGGADTVAVYADGKERAAYPRGTNERLLIDQRHYDGSSTNRIIAPTPLGKFAKALVDLWDMPVERRPLDLYERLMAVKSR